MARASAPCETVGLAAVVGGVAEEMDGVAVEVEVEVLVDVVAAAAAAAVVVVGGAVAAGEEFVVVVVAEEY